jgi:hypothetical protein
VIDRQADGEASAWTDSHQAALPAPTCAPPMPGEVLPSSQFSQKAQSSALLHPTPSPSSPPLLSPSLGTFNPSFDGQPRKDFFHILNLLAPELIILTFLPPVLPTGASLKTQGVFLFSAESPRRD